MASKTKKAKQIRKWKNRPNKSNLKKHMKRTEKNRETLKELAAKNAA